MVIGAWLFAGRHWLLVFLLRHVPMKWIRRVARVAALLAPASALCQTSDPVLNRIWAMGMDSSHTYQLSQTLFDSLGPRLMGGPDLRAAQNWLVKTYTSWGIDAKNEQYGTWRGWRRGASHIDLVEPR